MTAFAARADRVRGLEITLTDCASIRGEVYAVKDGNEKGRLQMFPAGSCRWQRDDVSFSTTLSSFSLRVDGMRTPCLATTPTPAGTGWTRFDCCANEAPDPVVEVTTHPSMHVSYLREVRKKKGLERARDCVEWGTLDRGRHTIEHVDFDMEKLHLQIGEEEAHPQTIGVRVNDLPLVLKNGHQRLTFVDVIHRLITQRLRDGTLSSNAIDLDALKLDALDFEAMDVRVRK